MDIDYYTTDGNNLSNDTLSSTIQSHIQALSKREFIAGIIWYSIIIPLSIIGNVIVVTAICRVQRLRHPTNFILMSLAIADLLVTTTVMIPGFIYHIKERWIFGPVFCKVLLANDITFCTASILHLVAVSFDRYVAIENPLKYKQKMTKRTIFIIIGCIWLISVLISYAPVFLDVYSYSKSNGSAVDLDQCNMRPNGGYSIVSSLTSFYIPLIIILFLYGRIFITARKHSHELQKLESIIKRLHSDQKFVLENTKWNNNLKAIRTLGIVVGVFVICWLPFFIMYVVSPFCHHKCFPPSVELYITWIGYTNSFCNPVIYAFSNKEFRNAFFEILHYNNCRCRTLSDNPNRTSISKSTHSMNTKCTSQVQSRQASVAPYLNQLSRNGHLPYDMILLPKFTPKSRLSECTNTYEMQIVGNQRSTTDVFNELEYLVPNGIPDQATISEMSSLLYDQDDPVTDQPISRKPTVTSRTNRQ